MCRHFAKEWSLEVDVWIRELMEHQVCHLIVHTVLPKNDDHCKWTCEFDHVEHHQVSLWFLHLADRICTLPVHLSCLTHQQHAFLPLPDQQAITLHETETVAKGNRMRMPEVPILKRRDGSLWMWTKCGFDFKPAAATCRPNVDPQLE
jgi:hypothetical protein